MIWGMTVTNAYNWHRVYLIWPRRLIDRRWAWLTYVERCSYHSPNVAQGVPATFFGDWSYRATEETR